MSITIPSGVWTLYNDTVNQMIDDFFRTNCTLVYPSRTVPCDCSIDSIGQKPNSVYKTGGFGTFHLGAKCVYCNGAGTKQEEVTENINLRVYENPKDWIKVGPPVNIPDNRVQVIGKQENLPAFMKCNTIILNSDIAGFRTLEYVRAGEPMPWGLHNKIFFVAFLDRA